MFSPEDGGEAGSLSSPEKFIQVFPALLLAPEGRRPSGRSRAQHHHTAMQDPGAV
jgi:hypothetical protein